ncbi:MAG: hypothetical protein AAF697_12755 [Pseudomonadota bacterium]
MKKLLFGAAAAALISSPAMAAPTASDDFAVVAAVQFECSVDDPETVFFGLLDIEEDSGADALLLSDDRYVERQRIWASCNYPTSITLEATPMTNLFFVNDGPDAEDFTDVLHYRLRMRADDNDDFQEVNLRTVDDSAQSVFQPDAFHNRAVLRTVINANDNPQRPLAGIYLGIAEVTLGAI